MSILSPPAGPTLPPTPRAPAPPPHRRHEVTWSTHLFGLVAGLAFTGVITVALAWFSRPPPAPVEDVIEEIRAVDLPEPPPPPPRSPTQGTPMPPAPMVFEESPSNNSVRIAPTPIPIATLTTVTKPTFSLHFDFNPGDFQPDTGDWEPDASHVFQRSEVDQQVVAIFKKKPVITPDILRQVGNPRVNLIFVVNADGTVQDVRLMRGQHPEFDRLIIEAISEWRFRPATRKGKRVRQMATMQVFIKAPGSNPFSTN